MKSMFDMGFRPGAGFESHRSLGQDWGSLVPQLITTGMQAYTQVNQADIARENLKAQQAAAAAAANNARAAAAAGSGTILGMNTGTAILGGIGIMALVGLVAILKSS